MCSDHQASSPDLGTSASSGDVFVTALLLSCSILGHPFLNPASPLPLESAKEQTQQRTFPCAPLNRQVFSQEATSYLFYPGRMLRPCGHRSCAQMAQHGSLGCAKDPSSQQADRRGTRQRSRGPPRSSPRAVEPSIQWADAPATQTQARFSAKLGATKDQHGHLTASWPPGQCVLIPLPVDVLLGVCGAKWTKCYCLSFPQEKLSLWGEVKPAEITSTSGERPSPHPAD